jgi:hypothetical protein
MAFRTGDSVKTYEEEYITPTIMNGRVVNEIAGSTNQSERKRGKPIEITMTKTEESRIYDQGRKSKTTKND